MIIKCKFCEEEVDTDRDINICPHCGKGLNALGINVSDSMVADTKLN